MQFMMQQAELNSGVKNDDAQNVGDLYEKLGQAFFDKLSELFYDKVYNDPEEWFRDIFKGRSREEAMRNQMEFFIQRMGGPTHYSDRKGNQTLISRHKAWRVDPPAAKRWLAHMEASIDQIEGVDDDSRERILKFFRHTAYLLVAAKEVMNKQAGPKGSSADDPNTTGKCVLLHGAVGEKEKEKPADS